MLLQPYLPHALLPQSQLYRAILLDKSARWSSLFSLTFNFELLFASETTTQASKYLRVCSILLMPTLTDITVLLLILPALRTQADILLHLIALGCLLVSSPSVIGMSQAAPLRTLTEPCSASLPGNTERPFWICNICTMQTTYWATHPGVIRACWLI